jgi:hypothetical protein
MTKKDYDNLIEWVSENKRMMEVTGAFDLTITMEERLVKQLYNVSGNGVAHIMNPAGPYGSYGGRTVQLMGVKVQYHPTMSGNGCSADEAIVMTAGGMNIMRSDIAPITKVATSWPIHKESRMFREYLDKVSEWCGTKQSPYFQRRDMERIAGCTRNTAKQALDYLRESGDVQVAGKWWRLSKWTTFQSTPLNGPNVFQLTVAGIISKKEAMKRMGLDYDVEMDRLVKEMAIPKEMM